MKTRSKIFSKAILCVLVVALTFVVCTPVIATTSSTTLTTTVPETTPTLLELIGNGSITISGIEYTRSETIEIVKSAEVLLQITPDDGYYIHSVTYNNCNYTDRVKNGQLILSNIVADATLCIVFERLPSAPATGDPSPSLLQSSILWMLISLMGIFTILILKKKIL